MNSPKTALASATREALRIADTVKGMLSDVLPVLANNDHELRKKIERSDDRVDTLFSHTKHYIATLMKKELSQEESEQALDILSFTANLEHIGDIIDLNLMEIAGKKIAAQTSFSSEGMTEISDLHSAVLANFDLAVSTFISNDPDLAALLLETKSNIRTLERESVSTHIDRIGSKLPNTLNTSSLHLDVLRDLKRINSHLTVVAYPVLRRFGELPESGSSS